MNKKCITIRAETTTHGSKQTHMKAGTEGEGEGLEVGSRVQNSFSLKFLHKEQDLSGDTLRPRLLLGPGHSDL